MGFQMSEFGKTPKFSRFLIMTPPLSQTKLAHKTHHLDIVHPDQQRPEIRHALHTKVYQTEKVF